MEKIKYLVNGKEDSAGHINEIIGADSITLHTTGNRMFVSVKMNSYKNIESKLAGKSPSVDGVTSQQLFTAELDSSLVEFHNMVMESLAKKHKLDIIEIEAELKLKSPEELKAEKDLKKTQPKSITK